jgi:hypothetical protein
MQKHGSMKTFLFKACPRCHGDLILDLEERPRIIQARLLDYVCLQCGRRTALENPDLVTVPAAASRAA